MKKEPLLYTMGRFYGKNIYFSGDSGFGSHYSDIAKVFPDVKIALIGAGAYAPKWFMGLNHQDPFETLKAPEIVGADTFLPCHYGTFDVADEPVGETEGILKQLKSEGKIKNILKLLKIGEQFFI